MIEYEKSQPVPRIASTIAMWVFLASLAMLFVASMFGYIMIRVSARGTAALGSIHLPSSLWVSTGLMLLASVTIHLALKSIRRERHAQLRMYLLATLALAGAFLLVQAPAMLTLWKEQKAAAAQWKAEAQQSAISKPTADMTEEIIVQKRANPLYAFIAFLILLHAAHVIGGVIYVCMVTYGAYHNQYDHEQHGGVRNLAMYWHFLDVVWIVMYVMLSFLG